MKHLTFLWSLFLSFLSLSAQPSGDKTTDGFEVSTVSSFMSVKYKWVKQTPKESGTEKKVNQTPLKREAQKRSEMEAVRANGESSQFTKDDLALNEVELRKFSVDEFYSPLLRMGDMKDIEILEPESASGLLKEKYLDKELLMKLNNKLQNPIMLLLKESPKHAIKLLKKLP